MIRKLALRHLESSHPTIRIHAARKLGVQEWLRQALEDICSLPEDKLSMDDIDLLEKEDVFKIMKARERYIRSQMDAGPGGVSPGVSASVTDVFGSNV
jgi:hypothetical protein